MNYFTYKESRLLAEDVESLKEIKFPIGYSNIYLYMFLIGECFVENN